MKINWDRWIRRDKWTLLFGGFFMIAISISLLYIDYTKPQVKKKEDLLFIKDAFSDYSWVKYSKGSRLTLRLQHYSNDFQIKADFYSILDKKGLDNISYGDSIEVSIPAESAKDLNIDNALIFSLRTDHFTLLDYRDAIKNHNSNLIKIFAVILFLAGVLFVYFGYKSKRR